ncbi:acetyl-coenzyme A transporter 1-like isoform X1 [Tubulanus polymorphus]|uniref:acetyl-coenzyme A transporter 1-like isoform X1 n=1 Tax=Tubulanus polymorphus TaxID=672921 RepID=UPI003DA3C2F6
MPVQARRSKSRKSPQFSNFPDENIEMDSELNFPHVPLHISYTGSSRRDDSQDENDDAEEDRNKDGWMGLKGDYTNVAVLLFLYVLQGIPLGLSGSIPLILQSRKVSYKQQAMFSFIFWPFSLKLLWAPIVDAVFLPRFGKRKTWLIPVQYLMGIFMLVMSGHITELLGDDKDGGEVNVLLLTIVFFSLYFLAATQDIAVDGWALTMLSRKNVGWASTCNTIGQTVGYSLGNIVFLALESPDFCNAYLRSVPQKDGVITFSSFLFFWGIIFILSTSLVWIFKHEKTDEEIKGSILQNVMVTYRQLFSIMKLPAVLSYMSVLLTAKMGFAAADAVTGLKLIEAGVPKEKLAMLAVPMVPIQILLPVIISKYTAGPKPMSIYLKSYIYRLFLGLIFAGVVWVTPFTRLLNGDYPMFYYGLLIFVYALHQVALYCMFVSSMSFSARISDPAIGGTYMTMLNTVSNLGGNWPVSIVLWFVDALTWKSCLGPEGGTCSNPEQVKNCETSGGKCSTDVDGYYIESIVCVIIGCLWLRWAWNRVMRLQDLPESAWTKPKSRVVEKQKHSS